MHQDVYAIREESREWKASRPSSPAFAFPGGVEIMAGGEFYLHKLCRDEFCPSS